MKIGQDFLDSTIKPTNIVLKTSESEKLQNVDWKSANDINSMLSKYLKPIAVHYSGYVKGTINLLFFIKNYQQENCAMRKRYFQK